MATSKSKVRWPPADLQTPPAAALRRLQDGGGERPHRPRRCGSEWHSGGLARWRCVDCCRASEHRQLQLQWLIGGRCAASADVIVNSDASSLLYRPAEDHHLYTAWPDILSTC